MSHLSRKPPLPTEGPIDWISWVFLCGAISVTLLGITCVWWLREIHAEKVLREWAPQKGQIVAFDTFVRKSRFLVKVSISYAVGDQSKQFMTPSIYRADWERWEQASSVGGDVIVYVDPKHPNNAEWNPAAQITIWNRIKSQFLMVDGPLVIITLVSLFVHFRRRQPIQSITAQRASRVADC